LNLSSASPQIQDYLEIRQKHAGDDHLFISQKRSPLSRREIHNVVKFYLERVGVPGQSAHSLRHLFATNLYNETKDIVLVREALGHRSIQTTLRYARKTEAEIAEKIEESELNIFRD
jgi:site-specific recombinase XerD